MADLIRKKLSIWDPSIIRQAIRDYEELLPRGGWPNWVLGNHDNGRLASGAQKTVLGSRTLRSSMTLPS